MAGDLVVVIFYNNLDFDLNEMEYIFGYFSYIYLDVLAHLTIQEVLKVPYALTTAKECEQRPFVWLLAPFLEHVFLQMSVTNYQFACGYSWCLCDQL